MTVKEIEARMAQIKEEVEKRGEHLTSEELDALETEARELSEKRTQALAEIEKRQAILKSVANGEGVQMRNFADEKPETPVTGRDSAEYRSAWLNRARGLDLTEVEKRALTTSDNSAGAAVPTQTASEIIRKVEAKVPMLSEVTLLHVDGPVTYAVEATVGEAEVHTESSIINAAGDTLVPVRLAGFEILKLIKISNSVKRMSLDSFEAWLTDNLSDSLARAFEKYLIVGTGASQPKGLDKAATWNAENSVSVTKAGKLTEADVQKLISLLPAGYDAEAKFAMSKKTLFQDFMPLQNAAKGPLVTVENGKYFVYGYPVLLSDYVAIHEAYLGAYRKLVANLAEDVTIHSAYDINTNSWTYSGVSIFDCAPGIGDAFVKLVKATS